ncbi:uridine kinase [Cellulomonas chitinilytica]|uniref:Uridine kinase n=1 Tax=Cellulomonas chitinilytica TaxID=398759 RepID=A0A919P410_9CELL|nr:uridine kinase [Cellulomonas chitinilytica]GIG22947.1 uridine kinase [Cellulomonas chitinilytica]
MTRTTVTPVGRDTLVAHVVERVLAVPGRCRVVVDGAAVLRPADLADALVGPLRAAGRAVARVHADDFLRPASLRWEHGRRDADAYLEDRLDEAALRREVLDPFAAEGRYLPSLWDAVADRATRAGYETAPAGSVLVVDGELLLGRGLDVDVAVHLAVRPATLARLLPEEERWLLPAFARYADEVAPEAVADVVVRVDDPRRPALVSVTDDL